MKNKILTGLLLVLIGGWGSLSAQNVGSNYARQVNTLIGTKGVGLTSGYLYPGATYPYGMVQFTPSYFSKRSGFVINQFAFYRKSGKVTHVLATATTQLIDDDSGTFGKIKF